jgi:hypothetical protein
MSAIATLPKPTDGKGSIPRKIADSKRFVSRFPEKNPVETQIPAEKLGILEVLPCLVYFPRVSRTL